MKVIINKAGCLFNTILEYLNYKLPENITRVLQAVESNEPLFQIYEKSFEYLDILFTIIENENIYKTEYEYFYKYSELHIEHASLDVIKKFISEASEYIEKNMHSFKSDTINVYTSNCCSTRWRKDCELKNRSLDTTYIPVKVKNDIINDISLFNDPKTIQRYSELGINHSRIYMFYGPPGCGKTTFIKSLASHFKKHIAYLTISCDTDDGDLKKCIKNVPKNTFLCLEDIDSLFLEKSRNNNNNGLTFSGFINNLDGIITPENSIIFMTTNNLENIEHAIIRRINYFIKFTFATKEQIKQMFIRFFPEYSSDFETFWGNINGIDITINILEKFFVKHLFDNIIEKSKLFHVFANGELKVESNNSDKLYT